MGKHFNVSYPLLYQGEVARKAERDTGLKFDESLCFGGLRLRYFIFSVWRSSVKEAAVDIYIQSTKGAEAFIVAPTP